MKRTLFVVLTLLYLIPGYGQDIHPDLALLGKRIDSLTHYADQTGRDQHFYKWLLRTQDYFNEYESKHPKDSMYLMISKTFYKEMISLQPRRSIDILLDNAGEAHSQNLPHVEAITLHQVAAAYYDFGSYDKAVDYYLKSCKVFEASEDWPALAFALVDVGNVYFQKEIYNLAKQYYDEALASFDRFDNESDMYNGYAIYYNNLGLLEYVQEDYEAAARFYRKGMTYREKAGKTALLTGSYNYLANCMREQGLQDSMLYFVKQAMINDSIHQSVESMIHSMVNYAQQLKFIVDKPQEGMNYLRKAVRFAEEYSFESEKAKLYYQIAMFQANDGQLDSTLYYLHLADSFARLHEIAHIQETVNDGFIYMYNHLEDYKNLSEHYKIKLEQVQKSKSDMVLKSQVLFEAQTRKAEKTEFARKQKSYRLSLILLIGLVILIVSFSLYLVYASLQRKKRERLLKETLDRLQEVTEHKDMSYSIIAHDLKGPLSSISNLLQIILTENITGDPLRELLKSAHSSLNQTYYLLSNLLLWANMQRQRLHFNACPLQVKELVDDCIELQKLPAREKEITLKPGYEGDTFIVADKVMLTTIICNLIGNALKFSYPGSEIEIKVVRQEDSLRIYVKDSGMGMDDEHRKRLFEKESFETRLGTHKERGSGLGLKLCKQFVELHNGDISVESEQGKGSVFTIVLPVHQEPRQA